MACRVVVYPGLGVRMPCGMKTRRESSRARWQVTDGELERRAASDGLCAPEREICECSERSCSLVPRASQHVGPRRMSCPATPVGVVLYRMVCSAGVSRHVKLYASHMKT